MGQPWLLFFSAPSHIPSLSLSPRDAHRGDLGASYFSSFHSASFLFSGSRPRSPKDRPTDRPTNQAARYWRVYHLANSVIGGFSGLNSTLSELTTGLNGANDLSSHILHPGKRIEEPCCWFALVVFLRGKSFSFLPFGYRHISNNFLLFLSLSIYLSV